MEIENICMYLPTPPVHPMTLFMPNSGESECNNVDFSTSFDLSKGRWIQTDNEIPASNA